MATIYGVDEFKASFISQFNKRIAPLNAFSLQIMDGEYMGGQSVSIGLVNTQLTASVFNDDNYGVSDSNAVTQVKGTFTHYVQPFSWAQTQRDVNMLATLETIAQTNADALANSYFINAMSNFSTSSYTAGFLNGIATSGFTIDVAKSGSIALGNNCPLNQCSFVIPGSGIIQAIPTQASTFFTEQVISGAFPTILGSKTYDSNIIPANAQSGSSGLYGVLTHPSALAVATAIPFEDKPESWLNYEVIAIDELGVSVVYKEYKDFRSGKTFGVFDGLIATAVGNKQAAFLYGK
jgi:hypothetical protein